MYNFVEKLNSKQELKISEQIFNLLVPEIKGLHPEHTKDTERMKKLFSYLLFDWKMSADSEQELETGDPETDYENKQFYLLVHDYVCSEFGFLNLNSKQIKIISYTFGKIIDFFESQNNGK